MLRFACPKLKDLATMMREKYGVRNKMILRNGSDHEQTDDKPAELTQLGGTKPVVVHAKVRKVDAPAQVTPVYTVQTVAGDKQTTESFK